MVKVSHGDLLAILKRFDRATETDYPRHIDQVKITHPQPTSTLVAFRFKKQRFYALFDSAAEDDVEHIKKQLATEHADLQGELVGNPQAKSPTYGMPFKGKDVYLWLEKKDKKRLDTILAEQYPGTSRSTWQKHIKAGYVAVNGTVRTSPKYETSDTDHIVLNVPKAEDFSEHELPILYLDDNVIVVNKPAGVLTHTQNDLINEFTVADFFRRYTTYGLDTYRPGIVHRLDRDTSGVIIGARNPTTARLLLRQFAERRVKKTYLAACEGLPVQPKARIELPIGRNPAAPSTFRVDSKGKTAITEYTVLATRDQLALVELLPSTGRTHQLRVHMRYIGTPIHGDRIYGTRADRLYLHAKQLEITIPTSERKTFTAPVPPEFAALFPGVSTV